MANSPTLPISCGWSMCPYPYSIWAFSLSLGHYLGHAYLFSKLLGCSPIALLSLLPNLFFLVWFGLFSRWAFRSILSKMGIIVQPPKHVNCSEIHMWTSLLFLLWVFKQWFLIFFFLFLLWTELSFPIPLFNCYSNTQSPVHLIRYLFWRNSHHFPSLISPPKLFSLFIILIFLFLWNSILSFLCFVFCLSSLHNTLLSYLRPRVRVLPATKGKTPLLRSLPLKRKGLRRSLPLNWNISKVKKLFMILIRSVSLFSSYGKTSTSNFW